MRLTSALLAALLGMLLGGSARAQSLSTSLPICVPASAAPAPASTYEDYALCADRSGDESAAMESDIDSGGDAAVPVAVASAVVIDCDDPRMAPVVGAMIGTCEMPRVRAHSRVPTLRPLARRPSGRAPDLFDSDDSAPVRGSTRSRSDADPALLARSALPVLPLAQHSPPFAVLLLSTQVSCTRLERPPRA